MFSSITYCPPLILAMIYPQLVQLSIPASPLHLTLVTPYHNLLCHADLPALSHSKLTTTHGWSQDVSYPLDQFAQAQVKASGLTVGGQSTPSPKTSIAHRNMLQEEAAYCVVNQSSSADAQRQSNTVLHIGFVACQNIWVNFALILHHVKGYVYCKTVREMGHYHSRQNDIPENITDRLLLYESWSPVVRIFLL